MSTLVGEKIPQVSWVPFNQCVLVCAQQGRGDGWEVSLYALGVFYGSYGA